MNRPKAILAGVVIGAVAITGAAFAQAPSQPQAQQPTQEHQPANPRGFDYWQPDWMIRELWGPGRMPKSMMARLLRHTTFMTYGVPKAYEGATSTVKRDDASLAAGGKLYAAHCASCHGSDGLGGGEGGRALSPSPALLAFMIRRPVAVDEYLLWSIADGGVQFNTEMPAFRDKLSRDEIWQIVTYMRAGFPQGGATKAGGATGRK